ncbi:hypothetical protein [Pararhizobium sp. IMCC21322]|uniref:hypothetical protein n=1 Tax=Pararhizobium sp. IMCC21322 TaxID=3067903 RepID=UPI0027420AC3|nr:hypothetical protein [Pararhizobium sp. IMCC21322]
MKHLVQGIAIAVAALMLSSTVGFTQSSKVEKRDNISIEAVKRVDVRGPKQFKRVLSGRVKGEGGGIVECQPINSKWCNVGFTKFCAESNGIGSSDPDGGLICTYPGAD